MNAIFLSASVPQIGRGAYHETADPFLIQCAVREFVLAVIGKHKIVWGGHPAITPMISCICEDIGADYFSSVVLYQSRFFADIYPEENKRFDNIVFTDAVSGDKDASLLSMREKMLSREDLVAAVFIGGMEGVGIEHEIFRRFHPNAKVLTVPAPGGAALDLAKEQSCLSNAELIDVDFARFFHAHLPQATEGIS